MNGLISNEKPQAVTSLNMPEDVAKGWDEVARRQKETGGKGYAWQNMPVAPSTESPSPVPTKAPHSDVLRKP